MIDEPVDTEVQPNEPRVQLSGPVDTPSPGPSRTPSLSSSGSSGSVSLQPSVSWSVDEDDVKNAPFTHSSIVVEEATQELAVPYELGPLLSQMPSLSSSRSSESSLQPSPS